MKLLKTYSFEENYREHDNDCGVNYHINGMPYSFEYEGKWDKTKVSYAYYTCLCTIKPYAL